LVVWFAAQKMRFAGFMDMQVQSRPYATDASIGARNFCRNGSVAMQARH
jgi:hypothetical protein